MNEIIRMAEQLREQIGEAMKDVIDKPSNEADPMPPTV
jgi:hypothetical protein